MEEDKGEEEVKDDVCLHVRGGLWTDLGNSYLQLEVVDRRRTGIDGGYNHHCHPRRGNILKEEKGGGGERE